MRGFRRIAGVAEVVGLVGVIGLASAGLLAAQTPPLLRVLPTGGLRAETAALLLSGQEGGGLPMAVLALALPGRSGGLARVHVVVEADGPALLSGHESGPLRVDVCLYAVAGKEGGEGILGSLLQTVEVFPEGLAQLEKSGLQFQGDLDLPTGEGSLRVLVRTPGSGGTAGVIGLRRVPLVVPDFGPSNIAVLQPPLVASPADGWLVAHGTLSPSAPPEPLPGDGAPTARPVVLPDAVMPFEILAYHLPLENGRARLTARLRRRSGGDREVELPVMLAAESRAGLIDADRQVLSASIALAGVEPGEYDLLLEAPGTAPALRSAALPLLVAQESAGKTWTAFAGSGAIPGKGEATDSENAAQAADEARRAAAPRARHRFAHAPVQAAYRQALRSLASGDEATARAAVSAFETAKLTASGEPLAMEDLIEVEANVVGEIARREPEAIVALLLLYDRLYHDALNRRAYLLATHDSEVLYGLSEVYVRKSKAADAKATAADSLVGLVRGRLDASLNSFQRRALERALTHDEGNEAALLALAADLARRGELRAAFPLLERLLRRHPESREGRLRLGVTYAHLGDTAKARKWLGEAIAPEAATATAPATESWILSLAYQELARIQTRAGELDRATQTVDAGLARLPGEPELLLVRASLLDRAGRHGEAREVVEAIQPRAGAGDTERNPRLRFNQPPEGAFERARQAIEEHAVEGVQAFARAMAEEKAGKKK